MGWAVGALQTPAAADLAMLCPQHSSDEGPTAWMQAARLGSEDTRVRVRPVQTRPTRVCLPWLHPSLAD